MSSKTRQNRDAGYYFFVKRFEVSADVICLSKFTRGIRGQSNSNFHGSVYLRLTFGFRVLDACRDCFGSVELQWIEPLPLTSRWPLGNSVWQVSLKRIDARTSYCETPFLQAAQSAALTLNIQELPISCVIPLQHVYVSTLDASSQNFCF